MTFEVRLTRDAAADLDRLFDGLLERALSRDGGDLDLPTQAISRMRPTSPFSPCATNSKMTAIETTLHAIVRGQIGDTVEAGDDTVIALRNQQAVGGLVPGRVSRGQGRIAMKCATSTPSRWP